MVVGSAQELAKRSKGPTHASAPSAGKPIEPISGEAEGDFPGMEKLSVPRGSVMVWDNAQAEGGTIFIFFCDTRAILPYTRYYRYRYGIVDPLL